MGRCWGGRGGRGPLGRRALAGSVAMRAPCEESPLPALADWLGPSSAARACSEAPEGARALQHAPEAMVHVTQQGLVSWCLSSGWQLGMVLASFSRFLSQPRPPCCSCCCCCCRPCCRRCAASACSVKSASRLGALVSGVKTFSVTDGADGGADGGVRQLRRLARSGSRRAGGGSRREGYPRSAPGRQTVGGGGGVRVVARHAQPPLRGVPGPCAPPASAHLLCDARKGCGPLHAAHDGDVCARRGLLEPCGFVRGLELHEACAVVQSGLPAAAPRDHHALQPHARAAQRCAAAGHARREHARAAQLLPRRGHRAPRARGARRVLPPQQKSPSKQLDASGLQWSAAVRALSARAAQPWLDDTLEARMWSSGRQYNADESTRPGRASVDLQSVRARSLITARTRPPGRCTPSPPPSRPSPAAPRSPSSSCRASTWQGPGRAGP